MQRQPRRDVSGGHAWRRIWRPVYDDDVAAVTSLWIGEAMRGGGYTRALFTTNNKNILRFLVTSNLKIYALSIKYR